MMNEKSKGAITIRVKQLEKTIAIIDDEQCFYGDVKIERSLMIL